jgi:hypothetical protein
MISAYDYSLWKERKNHEVEFIWLSSSLRRRDDVTIRWDGQRWILSTVYGRIGWEAGYCYRMELHTCHTCQELYIAAKHTKGACPGCVRSAQNARSEHRAEQAEQQRAEQQLTLLLGL